MNPFPLLCSWWRAARHSAKQNVELINVSRINIFSYVLCYYCMDLLLVQRVGTCDDSQVSTIMYMHCLHCLAPFSPMTMQCIYKAGCKDVGLGYVLCQR